MSQSEVPTIEESHQRGTKRSRTDSDCESPADIIKNVHKELKKKFLKSGDHEAVWNEHVKQVETLKSYAEAMHKLATEHWRSGDGNRIEWIYKTCVEYFREGGIVKWLEKDTRRRVHFDETEPELETDNKAGGNDKLTILDVGSCYNPFQVYDDVEVTAIDLKPVNDKVLQCDFLNVEIDETLVLDENSSRVTVLPEKGYDIVVFCLLLEYLPSAVQRYECVLKAWRVLKFYGLLVIVTPDSHKQHRGAARMKEWKKAIESLGFHRVKYEKLEHLHGMAFRKIVRTCEPESKMAELLYVPQDFNTEVSSEDELKEENPSKSIKNDGKPISEELGVVVDDEKTCDRTEKKN